VGGDETVMVWIGEHSGLKDEGTSVELTSVTTIWFVGSKGRS